MKKANSLFFSKKERILFILIVADIMFFPYILHLPIKLSMILLLLYPAFVGQKYKQSIVKTTLFLSAIGIASIAIGFLKGNDTGLILTNVQALIIIIYGYWIFEYFKDISRKIDFNITSFLLLYLFVAFLFAILYWVRPTIFFSIRPFWTLQRTGEAFAGYSENRFTFIMSEPNNFASCVNGVMAFLILGNGITKKEKIVVSFVSLILIISTQSISGTAIYLLLTVFFVLSWRRNKKKKKKTVEPPMTSFRKVIMIIPTILCIGMVIFLLVNIKKILSLDLIKSATSRYDLYFTDDGNDITGKRKDVWIFMIQSHNFFEYIFVGDASIGKPHSGNLFILYAFGLVFLIVYLRLFLSGCFKTTRAVILSIIFLIVFSTNTLIVDLRAFTLWAILLSLCHLDGVRKENVFKNNYVYRFS